MISMVEHEKKNENGWKVLLAWSEKHISLLQPANLKEFAVGGILVEE